MKILLMVILIAFAGLFGGYSVWDIAPDITWQDSDGGVPVERTLYGLIDQGKTVLITWGYNG